MERLLFIMEIYEDKIEEYERRHEEVWPQLLGDLWAGGWRNYSLFRRGNQVFGYAECHPTIESCLGSMANSTANTEWASWFTDVIKSLTDESGNLFMAEQVWHMNEEIAANAAEAS
jgi:L-rhamnose mutarotase